ncbi:rCG44307 [Rattus norvegicus]|uniref:RCG44307 n=1 Tax=Rattus norvegicus TaxID=10116 RepID=A6KDA9_RAT|nr:rCG44307 [Rattus norvegicus]
MQMWPPIFLHLTEDQEGPEAPRSNKYQVARKAAFSPVMV